MFDIIVFTSMIIALICGIFFTIISIATNCYRARTKKTKSTGSVASYFSSLLIAGNVLHKDKADPSADPVFYLANSILVTVNLLAEPGCSVCKRLQEVFER